MFFNYLQVGFQHVIPLGYDHILFIVALFFFKSDLKSAIIQCSIFTLAHSLTLMFVVLGYIPFNSQLIEVTIAASIFIVACENIFRPKLKPGRLFLIFVFGLIHGMGFAGALKEFGLPQNELIVSLVGFNIGVEVAQVTIILFCYYAISKWYSEREWYQKKLVKPLSILISSIALFWTITRALDQ